MLLHHRIVYPDGTVHDGEIDHAPDVERLRLPSLKGLRVLDLATNDGFFAFWAEQNGAEEVVAIDVGSYKDYDWGYDVPHGLDKLEENDKWRGFDLHHKNLSSKVIKKQMSVYDIESLGEFDIIFNYGLLYHLRNPVLALDKCRAVCKGFCVAETEIFPFSPYLPVSVEGGFWAGLGSQTDTYFPTAACLASWMKKACFPEVFIQGPVFVNRGTAVGVVDPKYLEWFGHMEKCDKQYWNTVRKTTKSLLTGLRDDQRSV